MGGVFGNEKEENKSVGLWLAIDLYNEGSPLAKELLKGMVTQDPALARQLAVLGVEV